MKKLILFTIYVLLQNNEITSKIVYEGMDISTIDSLIKEKQLDNPELTYQFVTQKEFDTTILPSKTAPIDAIKQQAAIDAKNPDLSLEQRLDALTKVLGL